MIISNNRIYENIQQLDIFKETEEQNIEHTVDNIRDYPIMINLCFQTDMMNLEEMTDLMTAYDEHVENALLNFTDDVYPEKRWNMMFFEKMSGYRTDNDTPKHVRINEKSRLEINYLILDRRPLITLKILMKMEYRSHIHVYRTITNIVKNVVRLGRFFPGFKVKFINFVNVYQENLKSKNDVFSYQGQSVRLNDTVIDAVVHTENMNVEFLVNQFAMCLYNICILLVFDRKTSEIELTEYGLNDKEKVLDDFRSIIKKYK